MKNKVVKSLHLLNLLKMIFCLFVCFALMVCTGTNKSVLEKAVPDTEQAPTNKLNWDDMGPVANTHHHQNFTLFWLPLTKDMIYLARVIAAAENFQVDGLQLSDEQWPSDLQNGVNLQERETFLSLLAKAQAAKQEIWYLTRESLPELMPAGLNPEENEQHQLALKEEYKSKYNRLIKELLPGLSGVVINLTAPVTFYPGASLTSQPLMPLQDLVSLVRNGVLPEQATVVVRYPAADPAALAAETKILAGLPADVIVESSVIPGDGQPFYPFNPVLGTFEKREQWAEFDLGLENQGENVLPYSDPELYLEQLRSLRDMGINTVCLRLDKGLGQKGKNALDTPWGQLNLAVFTAFKENPQVTADEIITTWEKKQFPGAFKLLQLTTAIVRRAYFPKKLSYAHASTLPEFDYLTSSLTGAGTGQLTGWSGADATARELAAKPTQAWLKEIQAEDLANLADLNAIEMTLGEKHVNIFLYTAWKEGMKALKIYVDLFRLHKQAYFAIRLYQTDPTAISLEQVLRYLKEFDSMVTFFSPLPDKARVQATVPLAKVLDSLKRGLESSP